MPKSIQEYMAQKTGLAAADIKKAYLNLPEDKRAWQPSETSRSAIDQLAEVTILLGETQNVLATHIFTKDENFARYIQKKEDLKKDPDALLALLDTNLTTFVATVGGLTEEELSIMVDFPWGPMSIETCMGYPFWNMAYHEGQINYIASLFGGL